MMSVSPYMDDEFRQWYNSLRERARRGIGKAAAIECTFTLLNSNLVVALHLGWGHGAPQALASLIIDRGRQPNFIIAGFATACGRMRVDILNNKHLFGPEECEQCDAEQRKAEEAVMRIADSYLRKPNRRDSRRDKDDGSAVGAKMPPPPSSGGGLRTWP